MITKKKILVVEDNAINRMMLEEILSPEYTMLEAENGQEALSVLEREQDTVSLILLDIVMPVMDGYTFLSIVKADPVLSSIPVIVTTNSDSEEDEVTALSHGATDFVIKPYKPQIILHRIASIISLRETAAMINLVQYDRLTQLYSKEFFYQKVREAFAQHPEQRYDLLCSDIENFKLVNDVFGLPAGDKLLCDLADLLLRHAGRHGICGRIQADQFVCLLERDWDYTDDMFIESAEEINALSKPMTVVIKWGIYPIEDKSLSVEQMCDRAILAAHSIKGQYGKYFATYDDALRGKLLRQQAITDNMESALAGGQFEVYLQPKYRIADERLAGAEALVRWNHPEWGLQLPGEFIPLFEKNGFITKLDQYIWDRACAILRDWDDRGLPPISISVNVSRADIYNADLADILTHTVEKYGLPPSRLHLEITESAYTENPSQIILTVSRMRELGFIIEMDDFGSGYSSLNMLNEMPIDVLKLDMKFIQNETAKPQSQGALRFIMALARWMHLDVVAEGVETRSQLERLREIGCDYVQGYYFAKPMPCGEFQELLKKQEEIAALELEEAWKSKDELPERVLLVVDEDPQYRAAVRGTFEDQFQIAEAENETAAMDCLNRHKGKLAAVILSMTLPGVGDPTLLQTLLRERSVWEVPIIATGPAGSSCELTALQLGANDFESKPHQQESLRRRTLRVIQNAAAWRRERALRDEAFRDYLTGLLNRRGLDAAASSLRMEDTPIAVYLFDLDHLKEINDTFGHQEGDQIIKTFSDLLRSHTREGDFLCRLGGDEFVAVIKRMSSEATALKKGEEICRAVQRDCRSGRIQATCSAGLVLWDGAGTMAEAVDQADQALYCAKANHKGGCCLWKG